MAVQAERKSRHLRRHTPTPLIGDMFHSGQQNLRLAPITFLLFLKERGKFLSFLGGAVMAQW